MTDRLIWLFANTHRRGVCRGCGADVIWWTMTTDRTIPMEPKARAIDWTLADDYRLLVQVRWQDSHLRHCPRLLPFGRSRRARRSSPAQLNLLAG